MSIDLTTYEHINILPADVKIVSVSKHSKSIPEKMENIENIFVC